MGVTRWRVNVGAGARREGTCRENKTAGREDRPWKNAFVWNRCEWEVALIVPGWEILIIVVPIAGVLGPRRIYVRSDAIAMISGRTGTGAERFATSRGRLPQLRRDDADDSLMGQSEERLSS